jgi:ABC-type transporter Mla MlaB component
VIAITVSGTEVRLSGILTTRTVTEAFRKSPNFSEPVYSVDLQEVDEVDSAGLALLVYWKTLAATSQSEIRFVNLPDKMHEMAALGGLDSLFIQG